MKPPNSIRIPHNVASRRAAGYKDPSFERKDWINALVIRSIKVDLRKKKSAGDIYTNNNRNRVA